MATQNVARAAGELAFAVNLMAVPFKMSARLSSNSQYVHIFKGVTRLPCSLYRPVTGQKDKVYFIVKADGFASPRMRELADLHWPDLPWVDPARENSPLKGYRFRKEIPLTQANLLAIVSLVCLAEHLVWQDYSEAVA